MGLSVGHDRTKEVWNKLFVPFDFTVLSSLAFSAFLQYLHPAFTWFASSSASAEMSLFGCLVYTAITPKNCIWKQNEIFRICTIPRCIHPNGGDWVMQAEFEKHFWLCVLSPSKPRGSKGGVSSGSACWCKLTWRLAQKGNWSQPLPLIFSGVWPRETGKKNLYL